MVQGRRPCRGVRLRDRAVQILFRKEEEQFGAASVEPGSGYDQRAANGATAILITVQRLRRTHLVIEPLVGVQAFVPPVEVGRSMELSGAALEEHIILTACPRTVLSVIVGHHDSHFADGIHARREVG